MSVDQSCIWPECHTNRSAEMPLPMCDRHAVKTYRAVSEHMRTTTTRQPMARPTLPTTARRNVKTAPGTVYFVQIGEFVKIGFTTDMTTRMRELRPDRILATMPGTMRDEEALHHKFGEHWVRGELFRPARQLVDYIAACCA